LLVGIATVGIFRGQPVRHMALLLVFPAVRSIFLMTIGSAEDRYTLECFPCVYLFAARWLATFGSSKADNPEGYIGKGGSASVG
jgi:hypothetical protein